MAWMKYFENSSLTDIVVVFVGAVVVNADNHKYVEKGVAPSFGSLQAKGIQTSALTEPLRSVDKTTLRQPIVTIHFLFFSKVMIHFPSPSVPIMGTRL